MKRRAYHSTALMNRSLLHKLDAEDDPLLWQVVMESVLDGVELVKGMTIEVGRCSHWLRPHQTRWTAAGGFAWPTGYGGGRYSRRGLPVFDWSVLLQWSGEEWVSSSPKPAPPALRITIPSRTMRHPQAAIHTLWNTANVNRVRFYGFRKIKGQWQLVAATGSDAQADERSQRREEKIRDKRRKGERRSKSTASAGISATKRRAKAKQSIAGERSHERIKWLDHS